MADLRTPIRTHWELNHCFDNDNAKDSNCDVTMYRQLVNGHRMYWSLPTSVLRLTIRDHFKHPYSPVNNKNLISSSLSYYIILCFVYACKVFRTMERGQLSPFYNFIYERYVYLIDDPLRTIIIFHFAKNR